MFWKEGDFKRWLDDAVFVGGKRVKSQKVAIDFCIHPDVALKKGAAYIFRKRSAWRSRKKILKNRKIQNILMTWTAQCVREDKNCVQMKCKILL